MYISVALYLMLARLQCSSSAVSDAWEAGWFGWFGLVGLVDRVDDDDDDDVPLARSTLGEVGGFCSV